ncbi:MAG TPA: hypothetical protein VHV47_06130 [Opitutaceae bacterium]|jgi:hypothetical protein|nr:hypothetical protein [Opitutaceae bacterium]
MRTLCSWLARILFLGCLALGWLLWRQQAQFQRAAADRAAAEKTADGATAELHRKIAAAKQAQSKSERKTADLAHRDSGIVTTVEIGGNPAAARIRFKQVHLSDVAKDHPDFPAILAKQQLKNVFRTYGDAVNQLDLPPDKKTKLLQLMADRQSTQADFYMTSESEGLQVNSAAGRQAMQQVTEDVDQQIGALVNQDGKTFMSQLQQGMGQQFMVKYNYAPDFEDAGVPLTSDQSAALGRALFAAQTDQKQNSAPASDDPNSVLRPYQQRQLAQAATVLSPAQLKVFQGTLEDQAVAQSIYSQYTKGGGAYNIVP